MSKTYRDRDRMAIDNMRLLSLIQKISSRCSYHSSDLDAAVRGIGDQADALSSLTNDLSLLVGLLSNASIPVTAKAVSDSRSQAWLSLELHGFHTTNYEALGAVIGSCISLICVVLLFALTWNCSHQQKVKKIAKVREMITTRTNDRTSSIMTTDT